MTRGMKPVYVGTNRFVMSLDPRTGTELWRTKLPKGGMGSPVTMLIKGQHLYVGHYGHVFCLDKRNGTIVWQNGLSKTGYHAVLLAMEGAEGSSGSAVAAADLQRRRQAAAGAGAGAGA